MQSPRPSPRRPRTPSGSAEPRRRPCPQTLERGATLRHFRPPNHGHVLTLLRARGGFLLQLEFLVLGEDVLVRSAVVWHLWVVMPAQNVRRPLECMMADPPAALCVTIHLAQAGIQAHAYGTDQGGLTKIRAETGPKVVIDIWSAVEGSRVKCEPVT